MIRLILMVVMLTGSISFQVSAQSSFVFSARDSLDHYGPPGTFFDIYAGVQNTSGDSLQLRVIRTRNILPTENWFTSVCNEDICYPPATDTFEVPDPFFGTTALPPDSMLEFHLNVTSDFSIPGNCEVTIRVENINDTSDNAVLNFTANTVTTGIFDRPVIPQAFLLEQNYPNPFNPRTVIRYSLSVVGSVKLEIYNIWGNKVRNLISENKAAGNYQIQWDGRDDDGNEVAGGLYFYRLRAGDTAQTRKMILIR